MIMLRGLKNRRSCTKKKKKEEEKKKKEKKPRKWFAYGYGRAAEGEWLGHGNGCTDDKKIFLGTYVVN